MQTFDNTLLNAAGLNRQAIFNIDQLPADISAAVRAACTSTVAFRQLILIGHAGRTLWDCVTASGIDSKDPIDDFSMQTVKRWFDSCQPQNAYEFIYPGPHPIGLQRLGQLAGWHHATPFKVGIDAEWGTWFAYRALVVADTDFEPSKPIESEPPCQSCSHRICIASCPASALEGGQFDFAKCAGYRMQAESLCKATCLARTSCPVGSSHRYRDAQIAHSYLLSLRAIERYR